LACVLLVLLSPFVCLALDNGLGRTPQMAWNSWNAFGCDISETLIRDTAKAMVTSGLHDVGYEYVNMDDCWASTRNATGYIRPDPKVFPSGIGALADFVHSLGLKFGLYSDAGNYTCATRPASLGFETKDATQYAEWHVDYLKYDNCFDDNLPMIPRYTAMRDALNKTGRPIFFSMCNWAATTAEWGSGVGNSWRTTADILNTWDSWTNNLDQNDFLAKYSGPGGWNDPDMLEVGNDLPYDENIAHYSLWALVKAPLILGNDLRNMTDDVLQILKNKEVIAVSQDKLGRQGFRVAHDIATNAKLFNNILYVDECTPDSPAQIWHFDPKNSTIESKGVPSYCVGQYVREWACKAEPALGAPLNLQQCGKLCDGSKQKFQFKNGALLTNYGGKTDCSIENVPGSAHEIQTAWNCSKTFTQIWALKPDGTIQTENGKCLTVGGGKEVWMSHLSDNEVAIVLFNRASATQSISVEWKEIGLGSEAYNVRDLWAHKDLGVHEKSFSAPVNSHGAVMIRLSKA